MTPVPVAPPATSPVTLDDAKAHLQVTFADDDPLIEGLIAAAVSYLDGYYGVLGFALEPQSWRVRLDTFPALPLLLPVGPATEIESITYLDVTGAEQAAPGGLCEIVDGAMRLTRGSSWPIGTGPVVITWAAGRGCPPAIRQAILLLIGHWYLNREAAGPRLENLPLAVTAITTAARRTGV